MTSYEKFKEAHKILYFIKIFYPQYYSTPFDGSFQILYEVWEEVLEEYSVDLIKEGIKSYVKSDIKGIPPTPGQVLSLMLEFMEKHVDDIDPETLDLKLKKTIFIKDFKKKE